VLQLPEEWSFRQRLQKQVCELLLLSNFSTGESQEVDQEAEMIEEVKKEEEEIQDQDQGQAQEEEAEEETIEIKGDQDLTPETTKENRALALIEREEMVATVTEREAHPAIHQRELSQVTEITEMMKSEEILPLLLISKAKLIAIKILSKYLIF
jgi:hypothetical protein